MTYIGPDATRRLVTSISSAWDANIMVAIAGAESGWNTTAKSPTDDWGLFQINKYWHQQLFQEYNWSNPYDNTRMAWIVWNSQHYHGWSTYNNGDYRKYLGKTGGGGDTIDITVTHPLTSSDLAPPPGPGGMDYSARVKSTGYKLQDAFRATHEYGRWLKSLH